jgi:hypothetical protein
MEILQPDDGSMFAHGDFITLKGDFTALNGEEADLTFGWKVLQEVYGADGLFQEFVDLSFDATKTFFDGDVFNVHLDMNIIEPAFYYQISFYAVSAQEYHIGYYSEQTITVYVGTPPTQGSCEVDNTLPYAVFDSVTVTAGNWYDADGISAYNFYFSYDGGDIYIPLEKSNPSQNTLSFTF